MIFWNGSHLAPTPAKIILAISANGFNSVYAYSTRLCEKLQTAGIQDLMNIKTNRPLHKPDFKPTQRFTFDAENPPKEIPPLRDGKGNLVLAPILCKVVAGDFSGTFVEGKTVNGTRKWSGKHGRGFYFSRPTDNSDRAIHTLTPGSTDNDLFIDPDDYEQEPAPRAERVPFDLAKFISNKETPVETRDGRAVTIGTVPVADGAGAVGKHPIHGSIQGYGSATFTCLGKWALDTSSESRCDLFFVSPPQPKKVERVRFNAKLFVSNETTPVVNGDGDQVHITRLDGTAEHCNEPQPVEGYLVEEGPKVRKTYSTSGSFNNFRAGKQDLFFVNPPPAAPQPAKKERVQFDVTKFISNEKTPVVDRKGRPAKIVRTDAPAFHCGRPQPVEVQGHVEGYPSTRHYYADGCYHVGIDGTDLFFA